MSEKIIAKVRTDIDEAEKALKASKDLITRLRQAGEDIGELEREQRRIELRVSRMKKAFAA